MNIKDKNIKDKIIKVLESDMTDYEINKRIGYTNPARVKQWRNDYSMIDNLKLETALKLVDLYEEEFDEKNNWG